MARTEARIFTEIWSDPNFKSLTVSGQRMYLFLLSQPDLAHDGVLALRERRWAFTADGMTVQDVWNALKELHDTAFVILDEEAGELLVRAHMRRDGVFLQPNVMRAAIAHLPAVQSDPIRRALFTEALRMMRENIDEVRLRDARSTLTAHQKRALRDLAVKLGRTLGLDPGVTWENEAQAYPSPKGRAKASSNPLGDRGQGRLLGSSRTLVAVAPAAQSRKRAPEPEQPTLLEPTSGGAPWDAEWAKFYAAYPKKRDPDRGRKAYEKLVRKEKVPAVQLHHAALNYAKAKSVKDGYAKYPATFLNAGTWRDFVLGVPEDERLKPEEKPKSARCPEHPSRPIDNCLDCGDDHGDRKFYVNNPPED